jgi:hypothetical protein
MYSDGSALQRLSRDECLTLLASVPVGRIIYTRRAAGHHHHEVAHLAPRDLQQVRVHLADHIIGVRHWRPRRSW